MGRKLALVLEYDGTAYDGFQIQAHAPTVQGKLQEALARLTGEAVRTVGAGRTDAGAHARGQVVSFSTASDLPSDTFVRGLNAYLPEDIAVQACWEVAPDFDARRSAASRWYRYTLLLRPVRSPLWRQGTYRVAAPLEHAAMAAACRALVGRHDLASFTTPEFRGASTVREVLRAEVRRVGELLLLDLEATAFLPQQVRRTVTALLQVGMGRAAPGHLEQLVQRPRLGAAGAGVPPGGLCLMAVRYPPPYAYLAPVGAQHTWTFPSGAPFGSTPCDR
ncbi:MAG: tRNA pseudouridine(38-40) synthase TruA [Chloroflexi bacterium]|nr:tRNA pseudouridine(38-40) synthase TruA [Chloroflexota bacterium]